MSEATGRSDETAGTLRVAMRLLRRCAGGQGAAIVAGLVLILASSGVGLLAPWPVAIVVDSVAGNRPAPLGLSELAASISPSSPRVALLAILCSALLLIHLLQGFLNVASTWSLVSVGLRMVFRLRCDLFNHIQRLSLRFHDSTPVGDSLYRVAWDSYAVQSIFNTGLIPALTASLTLVGIVAVMISRDVLVTGVALLMALPLIWLVRRLDKPMNERSMRVHEMESQVSTRVQETLSGIRAVQAFGREDYEGARFRDHAESSLRANLRLTVFQTFSQAVVGLTLAAGTALIVWIGAYRAIQGKLTAGDIVLMVAYIGMLFKPLEALAFVAANVQGAVAGARRVFTVLDSTPDIADAPGAIELPGRAAGLIELRGVSFAYVQDRPALREVSLGIAPGSTVALVGPSGAGKTTLVSLLMRFYDPHAGSILLDGHDLRGLTVSSLRRNIALVLQDPVLFGSTIGENIAYGLPDATPREIEDAARAAGAHEFIAALPGGYDTRISERGTSLSGGQRQRLSIARAFLKNAPVLIMDEPTSALDAQTENELLEAMERLKHGRTTIIIAHRLSTIRNADKIVVMDRGRVVEVGTHADLLDRGGLYSRLHQVQFRSQPVNAPQPE